LGTAENEADKLGASEISNSWGGGESRSDTSYDTSCDTSYFKHQHVVITASSGDGGYGVEYPAASQYVTAVGWGTSLTNIGGWSETAWSGAGLGCSAYDSKPTWQSSVPNSVCTKRAVADVSAVADPYTGVAVYDSYYYQGLGGWLVFGGTSVASPLIASVYALAGNAASFSYGSSGQLLYNMPHHLTTQAWAATVRAVRACLQRRVWLGQPDRAGHAQRHWRLLAPPRQRRLGMTGVPLALP
jgi:subtilase family serine protease